MRLERVRGKRRGRELATIHEAIERGVNVIDTGDFYRMGRNELLVGEARKVAATRRATARWSSRTSRRRESTAVY